MRRGRPTTALNLPASFDGTIDTVGLLAVGPAGDEVPVVVIVVLALLEVEEEV